MALFEDQTVEIYSSREQIRDQIVEYAQEYLELQTVDLLKTSFVSYIINVLSILSSNIMFYTSTVYREFFLLQAQLQESVYNLARWIGYTVPQATPSTVDVLIQMPMSFEDDQVSFKFPSDFKVYAGGIPFTIDSLFLFEGESSTSSTLQDFIQEEMVSEGLTATVLNNRIITIRNQEGFFYPIELNIEDGSDEPIASFILPFTQQEVTIQSFQIPDDLEFYQFYTKRLNVPGQVSAIQVYVIPPDAELNGSIPVNEIDSVDSFRKAFANQTEADLYKWDQSEGGIYTLTSEDKEYVLTIFEDSIEIAFGNGVSGRQPERGSSVQVLVSTTLGEEGNVIPGAITSGDTLLYQTSANRILRVKYSVVNTASAIGGTDLLTLSEIKANAITNLRSKGRLVSSIDYDDFNIIVPEVPLEGTIPILKRSDLKVNEISVFSQLVYNNPNNEDGKPEIVPTRNIVFPLSDTTNYFIPRATVVPGTEFNDFETIFNMEVDTATSSVVYDYTVREVDVSAALESTDPDYNGLTYIVIPYINFSSIVDSSNPDIITVPIVASVNHFQNDTITDYRAYLTTDFSEITYAMFTDLSPSDPNIVESFSYEFADFLEFPKGEVKFTVRIEGRVPASEIQTEDIEAGNNDGNGNAINPQWMTLSVYSATTVIRRNLRDFMYSTVTEEIDSTTGLLVILIHNVPVVLSSYLDQDGFDIKDFELNVIQKLITNVGIENKRMLTDFINIKFPDTVGKLTNMKYNPLTKTDNIISRTLDIVPMAPTLFDTYIVNGGEGIDGQGVNWKEHINEIARWTGSSWAFSRPSFDEFVYVDNVYDDTDPDQEKKLWWTGKEWIDIEAEYEIPFRVSAKISQDPNVAITTSGLVENVRAALLDEFASKFGMDQPIDKSEILKVIRSVSGVRYAELLAPKTDLKFDYELVDLDPRDLLDYTPQLVAFTEDTITLTVIN